MAAWIGACGPSPGTLRGHSPGPTALVGHVTLPEVAPGEAAHPFPLRAPKGKLLYVYFGYTSCPDICPATLSDFRRALSLLGNDSTRVEVALVTVDPSRDTAEVLAPYVRSFVPGAHALRPATQAELALAEAAFGATSSVVRQPDGKIEVSHTSLGYLVDEGGHILVEWDFGAKPEDLAHDMKQLLAARGGLKP